MVRGTSWERSSVYRGGWQGGEGIVKAQEVSYAGMYQVPNPKVYKERVKWRAKSILDTLLDEDDCENQDLLDTCINKGLNVFADRKP